jgi:hypothetical protein
MTRVVNFNIADAISASVKKFFLRQSVTWITLIGDGWIFLVNPSKRFVGGPAPKSGRLADLDTSTVEWKDK